MTIQRCGECGKEENRDRQQSDRVRIKKIPPWLFFLWYGLGKRVFRELTPLEDFSPLGWIGDEGEEREVIIVRCHHCGKPLCQKHRVIIKDSAFSIDEEKVKTLLPSWWPSTVELQTSKRFRALEKKVISLLKDYHWNSSKFKQTAYHCKACWQEYHPFSIHENE